MFRSNAIVSRIFRGSTESTAIQFIRYTAVGGLAFLVDFSCLFFLTSYLNVYYLFSAAIAFILGLFTNYSLSVRWVFSNRKIKSNALEFVIFAGIGVGGLALNELFIWFFTEVILLHYLLSKACSTVFVYVYNFVVRKFTLFS